MRNRRKLGVVCGAIVAALIVACSASRDEEDAESASSALHTDASLDTRDAADARDSAMCREETLHSHHCRPSSEHDDDHEHARDCERHGHEDDEDTLHLSPPFRFALPAEVVLAEHDPFARHDVELSFVPPPSPSHHGEDGDAIVCLYRSGPRFPAYRAVFVECSGEGHLHAGDAGIATEIELGVGRDGEASATVTLDELGCVHDAGVDAARDAAPDAPADAGHEAAVDAGTDAGQDAGPTCTPSTCTSSTPCVIATCTAQGCTRANAASGTSCSDGNACNGAETCNGAGACLPGTPPVCNSNNACITDGCSPATGCTKTPKPPGTSCSDGNVCNGAETCDGTGVCVAGLPLSCASGNVCVVDGCNPIAGCTHAPVAAGTSCSDGNACNGAETCNGAGACSPGTPLVCNSNNACIVDGCSPATGCTQTPKAAGSSCSDGNACNGLETCNGAGACSPGTPLVCNSNNPCVTDGCSPATGCTQTPNPVGTSCSDGNACNGVETCDGAGACAPGTPLTCTTSNACLVASCNPASGCTTTPAPAGTSCADNTVCNGMETCDSAGACQPGTPLVCTPANLCSVASCNAVTGCAQTAIPNCDPTPVQGDSPFEQRASILGKLVNASGGAVAGAVFTVSDAPLPGMFTSTLRTDVIPMLAGDGSFRLALALFPNVEADRTPPKHVLVRVDAPGLLPVYRDAWLHTGTAEDLGIITMVARDPAITLIGPAGGTASDSTGKVQVVIPPGALTTTLPIQITPFQRRQDISALLPPTTPTQYAFELEPSGTTFAVPVTVRVDNTLGLPTTLILPLGVFDPNTGRWEHEGSATWDGQRFAVSMTHFTTGDLNAKRGRGPEGSGGPGPAPGPGPCDSTVQCCPSSGGGGGGGGGGGDGGGGGGGGGGGDGGDGGPETPPDRGNKCASDATLSGGGIHETFALPTYRVRSEDFGVTLGYDSGLAASRSLGSSPTDFAAVNHSAFAVSLRPFRVRVVSVPLAADRTTPNAQPGVCAGSVGSTALGQSPPIPLRFEQSLAGSLITDMISVNSTNKEADTGAFIHLPLVGTQVASTGLYSTRTLINAATPGSCISSGGTFGVSDEQAPGIQTTLEPGPLGVFDRHVLVHHRVSSPFGAGWSIRELARAYRAGDVAYVTRGDGQEEHFRPRAYPTPLSTFVFDQEVVAQDPVTGEIFVARRSGTIQRIDVATGAQTTIFSGLPFGSGVHSLAVAYPGGARQFVAWNATQLLEIDGAGSATVLATRPPSQVFQQASVAARGNLVLFTDALTPSLYRVRLTDPARTVETLSLPSGGDVRLFPRSPLSGVSFADPRGLAFASDGTLYVTDVRRNELYALAPQANGEIGATSRVDAVVGDGTTGFLAPLGESYPGVKLALREPILVSVAADGTVFIVSPFGLATYDPIAQEAEWLMFWAGTDDTFFYPTLSFGAAVGLGRNTVLFSNHSTSPPELARLDIDRLSSEFEPTRTLTKLAGGGLELLDTKHATIEHFDAAGRITESRRRTGEIEMGFVYADAQSDKLDHVTDPAGGQISFGYDGSGKLATVSDPRGRVTQVTVDGQGDLVSFQKPDGERYQFTYAEHRITEKRSPRGDLTTHTFRADGTIATATRPGGATTTIDAVLSHPPTYAASGALVRASSFIDAHGVPHQFEMNLRGQIEKDTYVADGVTRVEQVVYANPSNIGIYGNANRLYRMSYRTLNGVPMTTRRQTFDDHYRTLHASAILDVHQELHDWVYRPDGFLDREFIGTTLAEIYDRDAVGHVTRRHKEPFFGNPNVDETLYTYRADGQYATVTEHNVLRTMSYDDAGATLNMLGWTDAVGRSMAYTLDSFGNVIQSSDGTATTFATFDLANRIVSARDALGNETTYGYSNAGCGCSQENLVTSIHTPDLPAGVDWLMAYDSDARLSSVTDPLGFTESYQYETTGELKKTTDKLLRDTTWSHDQLGRVLAMVDTLGRGHGNAYTIPAVAFSDSDFNHPPFPLMGTGPTLMAGSGGATAATTSLSTPLRSGDYRIGQNALPPEGYPGYISVYRDATFELGLNRLHDVNRRLSSTRDRTNIGLPIDSTLVLTAADAGSGTFYETLNGWNGNTGRPILATTSSATPTGTASAAFGVNEFFEYTFDDGFGFQPRSTNFTQRDVAGRVIEVDHFYQGGNPNGPISTYTYAADGRRLARLVNIDGTHDFTYNSRGLVETQTVSGEGTYSYGYDSMGRNNVLTFPDAHVRRQLYDDLGRITSRCYEYSLGTTRCYSASYDAVGSPVRMTDPEGVDVLQYDALDRLTKITRLLPDDITIVGVEDYAYNSLGALKVNAGVVLDDQRPKLAGGGTADAAVPATLGGQPVTLNGGGQITSVRGATFTYDLRGLFRGASDPIPAQSESYLYDAEFRRFLRTQGSTNEFYIWEGMDRVAVTDSVNDTSGLHPTGAKELYLFDGIDHPLRITIPASSTTAYYELDLAGNVRGLRASGGSDLGSYRYSAFGKTVEDTTTITQPLRWKGRWFSPIAGGIYDVRARQWSPELGAFLSVDDFDMHDRKGTLWAWGRQSPLRFRDPTGRKEANPEGEGCELPGLPPRTTDERCYDACDKELADAIARCLTNREPRDEYSRRPGPLAPCDEIANAAANDCKLRCQGRDPNNTPRPIPFPPEVPQPNDHPVYASGG